MKNITSNDAKHLFEVLVVYSKVADLIKINYILYIIVTNKHLKPTIR